MMGTYVEQSKKMFQQMQEQVENQTRNMFTGFQFPSQFVPHHGAPRSENALSLPPGKKSGGK
jgi:hypothetical protein